MWAKKIVFTGTCLVFLVASIAGCGRVKTTPDKLCQENASQSCTCPGDTWGVQYCNSDGTDWSPCNCTED